MRKATTNDRSGASGAGAVIGDASAPVQTYTPSPVVESSPTDTRPEPVLLETKAHNRQSVDWYGGLAADTYPSPTAPAVPTLTTMQEEQEEDEDKRSAENCHRAADASQLVKSGVEDEEGPEADFDMSTCEYALSCHPYS